MSFERKLYIFNVDLYVYDCFTRQSFTKHPVLWFVNMPNQGHEVKVRAHMSSVRQASVLVCLCASEWMFRNALPVGWKGHTAYCKSKQYLYLFFMTVLCRTIQMSPIWHNRLYLDRDTSGASRFSLFHFFNIECKTAQNNVECNLLNRHLAVSECSINVKYLPIRCSIGNIMCVTCHKLEVGESCTQHCISLSLFSIANSCVHYRCNVCRLCRF